MRLTAASFVTSVRTIDDAITSLFEVDASSSYSAVKSIFRTIVAVDFVAEVATVHRSITDAMRVTVELQIFNALGRLRFEYELVQYCHAKSCLIARMWIKWNEAYAGREWDRWRSNPIRRRWERYRSAVDCPNRPPRPRTAAWTDPFLSIYCGSISIGTKPLPPCRYCGTAVTQPANRLRPFHRTEVLTDDTVRSGCKGSIQNPAASFTKFNHIHHN